VPEQPVALHAGERPPAAILAADIAGYSRLIGQDEAQTLRDRAMMTSFF
jgi:class 3 adenylate cyclase